MNTCPLLTVITPTYNRAYTLTKAYASMCRQTNKDFIWLVVDDGSTDNTEEVISSWKNDGLIEIEYLKKENGGKASALNVAFDHITTPYCVCLDSDDYFTDNAVELSLKLLDEEKDNEKCCGVLALHRTTDGGFFGGKDLDPSIKYISVPEIHLDTEYARFYKMSALSNVRFPEFPGEKFVSPVFIDFLLAKKYKFRVTHESFCICEYMDDGLTKNKRKVIVKNPKGYTAVKRFSYAYSSTARDKVKNGIMYCCGCIVGRDKDWLKNAPYKVLTVLLWPLGYVAYIRRFKNISQNN